MDMGGRGPRLESEEAQLGKGTATVNVCRVTG